LVQNIAKKHQKRGFTQSVGWGTGTFKSYERQKGTVRNKGRELVRHRGGLFKGKERSKKGRENGRVSRTTLGQAAKKAISEKRAKRKTTKHIEP